MQKTNISYLDFTWNPGCGCPLPIPSAGCDHCWARNLHDKRYKAYTAGKKLPVQYAKPFHELQCFPDRLTDPMSRNEPAKIGVQFMGDLFAFPFEWIDRVFAVMALCPQHQFMCLTKRAGRMREYCGDLLARTPGMDRAARELGLPYNEVMYPGGLKTPCYLWNLPLPNVHLGVTVENQDNVGRMDDLVKTPRAAGFISFEPLLGDVSPDGDILEKIDYAFIGCESGSGARLCLPMHIEILMYQCQDVNVKVHVKQIPLAGKCNKNIEEWPEEFQVREI